MADAVRERGDTFRICNGRVDSRATLHSTRGSQATYAYFDPGFGIALRRREAHAESMARHVPPVLVVDDNITWAQSLSLLLTLANAGP